MADPASRDNGYLPVFAYAPVVQWIGRELAELVTEVRALSGAKAWAGCGCPAERDNTGSPATAITSIEGGIPDCGRFLSEANEKAPYVMALFHFDVR